MELGLLANRIVMTSAPALALRGITKRFGGVTALEHTDFTVQTGTLHALLGENGAGKSTLMRLAFGMLRPDEGVIEVEGSRRSWRSSADAIAAGLGMVHQHFLIVPAMTVADNVALGDRGFFAGFSPGRAAERVRQIAVQTGLSLDPAARADELPVGAQQRLEIVKALARDAHLLILDEPTAVLSPSESRDLYVWLRAFVDRGNTVVLITHKVREALAVADEVTVLRRGFSVLTGRTDTLGEDGVVSALLGDESSFFPPSAANRREVGPVRLLLDAVSVVDSRGVTRLKECSATVRGGEILGIAGVEGAGQHELLRLFAGRIAPAEGRVVLPNRIGFVPEDRLRDSLVGSMTLTENFALKESGRASGTLDWSAYASRTATAVRMHDVRTASLDTAVSSLSGGNQQKFVFGRELEGNPDALVVESPTRGLDLRAAAQVLAQLRQARDDGVAVVAYSSDIDEVLSIADRMLVCFAGRVTETAVSAADVGRAMVGATA